MRKSLAKAFVVLRYAAANTITLMYTPDFAHSETQPTATTPKISSMITMRYMKKVTPRSHTTPHSPHFTTKLLQLR